MKRFFILFALSSLLTISCEGYDTEDGGNIDNGGNGGNITDMQKKSISGSRIVFREYELADGAIYYENTPFDTEYNRVCYFNYLVTGLEDCCVSYRTSTSNATRLYYRDSSCSQPIDLKYSGSVNVGDIVLSYTDLTACTATYTLSFVTETLDPDSLYVETTGGECEHYTLPSTNACYTYFTVKELTTDEARSLFVCAK